MATRERSVDIDVTKLVAALRRRFKTPRELLARLGIDDAAMLKSSRGLALDQEVLEAPNGSPSGQGDAQWRLDLEKVLTEGDHVPTHVLRKVYALLDQKHPLSDDQAEPLTNEAGEVDPERLRQAIEKAERDGDMALVARLEKMAAALRNGEDDLSGAERGELRRRERHGEEVLDDMPVNALGGSLGGKFAQKRGAMDAAARLDRKFNISRIVVGDAGVAERAVDRRQPAIPSRARLERIDSKFGTARIGVHDGAGGSTW